MQNNEKLVVQSKIFEFAFSEIVRNKRESFQPIWTVESWVKFLIWLALNCGFSGENDSLKIFLEALGPNMSMRMRRIFFERVLADDAIHVMADPAEPKALLLPLDVHLPVTLLKADLVLKKIGLSEKVLIEKNLWELNDGIISVPWKGEETCS